jgi:hypothetical protein
MVADDFEKNLFEIRLLILEEQFTHAALGLQLALVENRHAIADGLYLAEFVGREEHGLALDPEALDNLAHFMRPDRSSPLVGSSSG